MRFLSVEKVKLERSNWWNIILRLLNTVPLARYEFLNRTNVSIVLKFSGYIYTCLEVVDI